MVINIEPMQTCHHYGHDLKEHIVFQHKALEKKPIDIAKDLDISLCMVQRVLQLWNEIGDVVWNPADYATHGRPRLLNVVACNVHFDLFKHVNSSLRLY
jgi:hypothetical protein